MKAALPACPLSIAACNIGSDDPDTGALLRSRHANGTLMKTERRTESSATRQMAQIQRLPSTGRKSVVEGDLAERHAMLIIDSATSHVHRLLSQAQVAKLHQGHNTVTPSPSGMCTKLGPCQTCTIPEKQTHASTRQHTC